MLESMEHRTTKHNLVLWKPLYVCGLGRPDARTGVFLFEVSAMKREQHGLTKAKEHGVWASMKSRCNNPKDAAYAYYGGRGITVCERWNDSFLAFYTDMGERPTVKHTLDRVDNDGDYTPENCAWVTRVHQARNKRNNRNIVFDGESRVMAEWAVVQNLYPSTILRRLQRGWTVRDALTKPPRKRPNALWCAEWEG